MRMDIKTRTIAILASIAIVFSSMPVYAEEQAEAAVVEIIESTPEVNNDGGDESGNAQDNIGDVVELTVTIEEIAPTPTEATEAVSESADYALELSDNKETVQVVLSNEEEEAALETNETSPISDSKAERLNADANLTPIVENSDKKDDEISGDTQDIADSETATDDTKAVPGAGEVQNGEIATDQMTNIRDSYDYETGENTSPLNYTKVLSDFSYSQSSTGRYNATFVITETEQSTGTVKKYNYTVSGFKTVELARAYAEKIQEKGRYSSGETKYIISDANLVDAEKRPLEEDDNVNGYYADLELCWAGASSNMLELSGWNKAIKLNSNGENVSNEDALLDLFSKTYTNQPGNPGYGLEWFFNGIYRAQNNTGWSHLRNNTNGYTSPMLKEYCSSDFIKNVYFLSENEFGNTLKSLDADDDGDRCIIGLTIGYYACDDDGNLLHDANGKLVRDGGHCITIAGYSTDENGVPNTITLIDSDSYDNNGQPSTPASDRSSYINTYTTYPVRYYDGYWHVMNYYEGNSYDNIIDELDLLKYYSSNTAGKLEQGGTLDLVNDYDLTMYDNYLNYNDSEEYEFTVYQGDELSGVFCLYNRGLKNLNLLGGSNLTYKFILSKDGTEYKTFDYSDTFGDYGERKYATFSNILMDANNPLEEGEYTVSYIINCDKSITEAYYNNNKTRFTNKFIVIKRVAPSGDIDYIVIPDTSNDENNDDDNRETYNNEYQEMITEFLTHINDYSVAVDQDTYTKDNNKTFEFAFSNNSVISNVTDADLLKAEIMFDYSVSGDKKFADGNFGGNITSRIALTKSDYSIIRKADGTVAMVFSNEFMRKLPKGTHYFKLMIGGKVRLFKIEIK